MSLEETEEQKQLNLDIDINVLYEVFTVIYTEGMWQMLSPQAQGLGREVYKFINNEELPPTLGTMKYSVEQHLEFVANVVPTPAQQSDFWKLVTQISWFMMLIEKNPMIAQKLMESDESKEEILKQISKDTIL